MLIYFLFFRFLTNIIIIINIKQNRATMAGLRDNGWLDDQTRAVYFEFTAYNANINSFTLAKIYFEFLPSGGLHPGP